jgi:hypothetical protein
MATARERLRPASTYDEDIYGWALEQAALLRARRFDELDLENLVEEIEDLARSAVREVESRFTILLAHLLKWQHQPAGRSWGWVGTIDEQRGRIAKRLQEMPSLRRHGPELLAETYRYATSRAVSESRVPRSSFPPTCPFTFDQAMDESFWPGEPWPGFAEG